ncbi:Cys-tRNA(Pro) deacylase [Lepagella muris]|nr:Cys-tRNA(Pro) deacylase [Lepagella muris]
MMSEKTNAARILDRLKIKYELVEYTVDPDNLAADHVAEELGEHIEQVYKTLVLRGDKTGIIVCVVAGNREVDLKKAAKASGNKKVEMIAMKELLPLTGYIRGGCTAIGMKKHYPTYISEEAQHFPFIYVSAGKRGLQLKLSPLDLAKAAQASFAEVATIE